MNGHSPVRLLCVNYLQDIDGLEVIGSSKPSTFVTVCGSPLLEKEEGENEYKEMERDNLWVKALNLALLIYEISAIFNQPYLTKV